VKVDGSRFATLFAHDALTACEIQFLDPHADQATDTAAGVGQDADDGYVAFVATCYSGVDHELQVCACHGFGRFLGQTRQLDALGWIVFENPFLDEPCEESAPGAHVAVERVWTEATGHARPVVVADVACAATFEFGQDASQCICGDFIYGASEGAQGAQTFFVPDHGLGCRAQFLRREEGFDCLLDVGCCHLAFCVRDVVRHGFECLGHVAPQQQACEFGMFAAEGLKLGLALRGVWVVVPRELFVDGA